MCSYRSSHWWWENKEKLPLSSHLLLRNKIDVSKDVVKESLKKKPLGFITRGQSPGICCFYPLLLMRRNPASHVYLQGQPHRQTQMSTFYLMLKMTQLDKPEKTDCGALSSEEYSVITRVCQQPMLNQSPDMTLSAFAFLSPP